MGELDPRFKCHCNLTEQPIVLISIQLEIMMLMLGCPFRDLRSDPSRPHLSSCHLAQILKYSPLADTKYDYPHTPTGPYPPPTPSSLTVSGKGSGVAKVVHSLATQRVDQITDQKAPTCIEPDWSLSCNIRGLAGRWRIRREHNPPSPP